jgi:acetyl esterase
LSLDTRPVFCQAPDQYRIRQHPEPADPHPPPLARPADSEELRVSAAIAANPYRIATPARRVRLSRMALKTLGGAPRWARRLIGGRPIVVDGQRLHPEIQLVTRLLNAAPGEDLADLPVERGRAVLDNEASIFGGRPRPCDIESITIPTDTGSIPARLYRPRGTRPADLVVYFHGGGWVLGSLDSHNSACSFLAERAEVCVLSVGYRLAPEHPFPAGVDDAVTAFRFAVQHAAELGVDPSTLAVAGDSAGGNLAAVVAQTTARTGEQAPALQVLIVPVTDLSTKHPSYRYFGDGYFLTDRHMDWYKDQYLTDAGQALDPRVSPLLAEDLSGLPPAYVAVAGFDPLRDEGIAYAHRLRDAGVQTVLRVHTGLIHPFSAALGAGRACAEATLEIATAIRFGLASARAGRSAS